MTTRARRLSVFTLPGEFGEPPLVARDGIRTEPFGSLSQPQPGIEPEPEATQDEAEISD